MLLNHTLSTVTEISGPSALNTLIYASIFIQCKSRLGFTDVICTGPEGFYGSGVLLVRTELHRQKFNKVNWLECMGCPWLFPVSIPCTSYGRVIDEPFTHLWLFPSLILQPPLLCHVRTSSQPVSLVGDSDTLGSCSGSLPCWRGLAAGQEHSRLPTDFKASISGFPRALPLNLGRQG